MKTKKQALLLSACVLAGCVTKRTPAPVETMGTEMGWFSAIHAENPNAMIDGGWNLVLRGGPGETGRWYVGGREKSEAEMREILSQLRKAGVDGVLLNADDNVPVGFVRKTLKLLHQYGQRHVVLLQLVEGVQSDFFADLDRFRRSHPEMFEEKESNNTPEDIRR